MGRLLSMGRGDPDAAAAATPSGLNLPPGPPAGTGAAPRWARSVPGPVLGLDACMTARAEGPAGTRTLAELGEFPVIAAITERFGAGERVLLGPGDDAAVVRVDGVGSSSPPTCSSTHGTSAATGRARSTSA